MKANEIQTLKITDFENFFDIYEDRRGNYSYNLNQTVYLNVAKEQCEKYTLKTDAFWPLISYKLYQTTHLAWLLMKINDVKASEMFEKKHAGDIIYYLPNSTVEGIVTQL